MTHLFSKKRVYKAARRERKRERKREIERERVGGRERERTERGRDV